MRSSQWFLIGIFLIVMSSLFIYQDLTYQKVCGVAGIPPEHYTSEEWIEKGSEPVDRVKLWCINTEIYDPFIWLLYPLGIVFIICGGIELFAEKRKPRKVKFNFSLLKGRKPKTRRASSRRKTRK